MKKEQLLQERRYFQLLFVLAIFAAVGAVVVLLALKYSAERYATTLPAREPNPLGELINETTCASSRCHPVLEEAPITSRHANIRCVTCHSQRRSHNEQCVTCHDQVKHHTQEALDTEVAREQMAAVRADMKAKHELARTGDPDAAAAFPEPVRCVTCHLQMATRPVTFPQVALADHLPEGKTADDCGDCHRAHDPKPLLAHPLPAQYCQFGRDCCLGCHGEVEDAVVDAAGNVVAQELDLSWEDESFVSWAHDTFGERLMEPPRVAFDHGHTTVECIACHGAPPSFDTLARRVHNFQMDTVRCGKCHTGATIVDQQVMHTRAQAEEGEHGASDSH